VAASEADLSSVVRLRRDVIGGQLKWDDPAYLRWRYVLDGADVGELARGRSVPRLWLFKRGEEVLGCLGAEPVELASPGRSEAALRFMDLMVLPRVNGLGIGAWLNLMLLREVAVGISVGGSDQSIGMIGRLFRRLQDRHVWSLPIRSGPLLASRWPKARALEPVSRVVDLGLAAGRRVVRAMRGAPIEHSRGSVPDPAIGALGDSMVASGLTMVRRSEKTWRWRYAENPRCDYEFHTARWRGRVVAVLVTRQRGEVAHLVDWLWDAAQTEKFADGLLLSLLVGAVDAAARQGASRVRAMTHDPVTASVCRRLGMVQRPDRAAFAIRARPPSLEKDLAEARWFVTFGDSDGD
jgi:hypothetical protein